MLAFAATASAVGAFLYFAAMVRARRLRELSIFGGLSDEIARLSAVPTDITIRPSFKLAA